MNSTSLDLHATLDFAESLARQAGAVLRQYFEQAREADHKRAMIDLVTQADRQSEALIVRELQAAFPDHFIHGEEGGGYGPGHVGCLQEVEIAVLHGGYGRVTDVAQRRELTPAAGLLRLHELAQRFGHGG